MKKLVVFAVLPVAIPSFFGFTTYQTYQNNRANQDLVQGVQQYRRAKAAWPHDFEGIKPYLRDPDTIRSMAPTFLPINANEAYMEENQWSTTSAKRASFRLTFSSTGTCSMRPSARL